MCVSVRSFLPPRASRPRNIGTYVFTATRKKCFVLKLQRHLLASNATNYSGAPKYGYQRNPGNVGMTLLFAILTKNPRRSEVTVHLLTSFVRMISAI